MIFGPIFSRELCQQAKKKSNYILRCAYVGLVFLFLAMFWPRGGGSILLSDFGRSLLYSICGMQFILVSVLCPIATATTISIEKEKRTLDLLLLTSLRRHEIILGKFGSRISLLMLLLAAALPALCLVVNMGGLTFQEVLFTQLLIAITAILAGSIGIFFATLFSRGFSALFWSFLVFFGSHAAILFGLKYLGVADYELYSLPYALRELVSPPAFSKYINRTMVQLVLPSAITSAGVSFLLLALSTFMLERTVSLPTSWKLRLRTKVRGPSHPVLNRLYGLVGHGPLRHVKNAVAWREARVKPLSQPRPSLIFHIFLLIAMGASYAICWPWITSITFHAMYVSIMMLALILVAGVISAVAIVKEKETNSLEILTITPLDEVEIIEGKYRGIIQKLSLLACYPILHALLFVTVLKWHTILFVIAGAILHLSLRFHVMQGLYISTLRSKSISALAITLATMTIELVGSFFCCAFWFLNPIRFMGGELYASVIMRQAPIFGTFGLEQIVGLPISIVIYLRLMKWLRERAVLKFEAFTSSQMS